MVDEEFQGRGIGTFLLEYLVEIAQEQGIEGFRADVLATNKPMLSVFQRLPYKYRSTSSGSEVRIRFRFDELKEDEPTA
jgi:ribosomal protein S18 acetylase RimI-like enzyme